MTEPTDRIQPPARDPVPYDDWSRALTQISAALRPRGLMLVTDISDGTFRVEPIQAEGPGMTH